MSSTLFAVVYFYNYRKGKHYSIKELFQDLEVATASARLHAGEKCCDEGDAVEESKGYSFCLSPAIVEYSRGADYDDMYVVTEVQLDPPATTRNDTPEAMVPFWPT
jgi:hypothetical protein